MRTDETALAIHGGAGTLRPESMSPDREAAFHAGIRVKRIKLGLFVLSGIVCAAVGILTRSSSPRRRRTSASASSSKS